MKTHPAIVKPTIFLLVVAFSFFNVLLPAARAALIPTGDALLSTERAQTRERLQGLLDRAEVRDQLVAWGVDPQEALARVDALSGEELDELSARMDQLPAGGSALGTIAVVTLIAFLVLLVTDILGYTDIFPFTR